MSFKSLEIALQNDSCKPIQFEEVEATWMENEYFAVKVPLMKESKEIPSFDNFISWILQQKNGDRYKDRFDENTFNNKITKKINRNPIDESSMTTRSREKGPTDKDVPETETTKAPTTTSSKAKKSGEKTSDPVVEPAQASIKKSTKKKPPPPTTTTSTIIPPSRETKALDTKAEDCEIQSALKSSDSSSKKEVKSGEKEKAKLQKSDCARQKKDTVVSIKKEAVEIGVEDIEQKYSKNDYFKNQREAEAQKGAKLDVALKKLDMYKQMKKDYESKSKMLKETVEKKPKEKKVVNIVGKKEETGGTTLIPKAENESDNLDTDYQKEANQLVCAELIQSNKEKEEQLAEALGVHGFSLDEMSEMVDQKISRLIGISATQRTCLVLAATAKKP
uniref:Uncharacterized protein n=1 Tax=Panagrolaimus sp. ES5 TaxID=591445 RepID=A0AC34FYU0_9BILA